MSKITILLSCPFCGGEPKKTFIGNDHTRSRKVEIKCTKCFTKQVTATLRYGFEQCEEWANEKWNARFTLPDIKPQEPH